MTIKTHHLRVITAAGLDPAHVLEEVYLAEDCEHLVVELIAFDVDGRVIREADGETFRITESLVPLDPEHPWLHDWHSFLPRIGRH